MLKGKLFVSIHICEYSRKASLLIFLDFENCLIHLLLSIADMSFTTERYSKEKPAKNYLENKKGIKKSQKIYTKTC